MTNGGFAAIAVALRAIVEPGDEVVFLTPPWFFYEILILAAGGVPVRVPLGPPDFDIDREAIAAAITPRTRAVLLNTPHNPSGRVYPIDDLMDLAGTLEAAGHRIGRPIYLICDEPYNRIVFDGRTFHTPGRDLSAHDHDLLVRQDAARAGHAHRLPDGARRRCPDREVLRDRILLAQIAPGYAFPNALLQHAIEDLTALSIDVPALQRRRDRLVPALRDQGYETTFPEGTFYVMARSPIDDDVAFAELLAEEGVLVLPGTVVEVPGWFRISLTATDEMVDRGLGGFERARARAIGALTASRRAVASPRSGSCRRGGRCPGSRPGGAGRRPRGTDTGR